MAVFNATSEFVLYYHRFSLLTWPLQDKSFLTVVAKRSGPSEEKTARWSQTSGCRLIWRAWRPQQMEGAALGMTFCTLNVSKFVLLIDTCGKLEALEKYWFLEKIFSLLLTMSKNILLWALCPLQYCCRKKTIVLPSQLNKAVHCSKYYTKRAGCICAIASAVPRSAAATITIS